MTKSLGKIEKKAAKKKATNGIHGNSKIIKKLKKASARSERLDRSAASRARTNQPLLQRVAHFQHTIKGTCSPVDLEGIHVLIQSYLNRADEEIAELRSQRRPGRPASAREDALEQRATLEENEYNSGFWVPDLRDEGNVERLGRWNGDWGFLNTIKFIRVLRGHDSAQDSSFPPKG